MKKLILFFTMLLGMGGTQHAIDTPGYPLDFDGPTSIAVFLVEFQDIETPAQEFSAADETNIDATLFGGAPSVKDLFAEMSWNTDQISGQIIGTYTISYDGYQGSECQYWEASNWAADVLEQVDPNGTIYTYDGTSGYDMLMFIYSKQNNCDGAYGGVNGVAHRVADPDESPEVGDPLPFTTILNWRVEMTMAHELGHLKGWNHSELLDYEDGYGDRSCLMGDNYVYPNHPEYPIVVPNPEDPPLAAKLKMRGASAPYKIHAGYIDLADVHEITPSTTAQTFYLAPTELDPALGFPTAPNQEPVYHAVVVDVPEVNFTYVVSFRHQSMSAYNLDFPDIMGRVHVHRFETTGSIARDVTRVASLAAGETGTDGVISVTAVTDGLAGEDLVEFQIATLPFYLPTVDNISPISENNPNGLDSAPFSVSVTNPGPVNTAISTFDLSLGVSSPEISGALFTPASLTLAPGESATAQFVLQFGASTLPEKKFEFEVVATDTNPAHGRLPGSGDGVYRNDTTPPPAFILSADHESTQINVSWELPPNEDHEGYSFDVERDGVLVLEDDSALEYADTNVVPGSTHVYRVQATDLAGNTGPWSAPVTASDPCVVPATISVNPTDFKRLAAPSPRQPNPLGTFVVTVSNNNPAECGAETFTVSPSGSFPPGYQVYPQNVALQPGETDTVDLTVNYFTQPQSDPPETHFSLSIQAEDSLGFESNPVSASFAYDTEDPGAPGNGAASLVNGQAILSWSSASDNVGVARYDVYGPTGFIGSTSALTYTVTTPDPCDLNYQVIAVDYVDRESPAINVTGNLPSLSMNHLMPNPSPSSATMFSVTVTNNDPAGCAADTIFLNPVPGSGYTIQMMPSLTLAAGASGDAVGVLISLQDGQHDFQIDVEGQLVAGSYLVDTTGPTAPPDLIGSSGPGINLMSWGASKDVTTSVDAYRVYRDGIMVYDGPNQTYIDNNPPTTGATYTVYAFDTVGNNSQGSSLTFP